MADLDIAEKRVPQDGRVSLTVEGHAIDTRVVTMPRVDGEGIVMRILDKTQALIGLDHLGMAEASEELFEDAFKRSYGAVLVTGSLYLLADLVVRLQRVPWGSSASA